MSDAARPPASPTWPGPSRAARTTIPGVRSAPRVVALTAATLACFAANSLLCRAALGAHHIDAASFTAIRIAAGALVLAVIAIARGGRTTGGSWGSGAALFAYAAAFSFAYLRIQAGTGALLLFGAVQTTMIGWGMARGTRPTFRQWAGIALASAGLAFLVAPGVGRPDALGAVLMFGAGAAWGCYSMRGRGSGGDPVAANAGNFLRAIPFALVLLVATAPPSTTASGVALAVASGAVASGIGYSLWYTALPQLGATRAAVVQLAVPVVAASGAVIFLDEHVTARLAAAGAAVLLGIGLVAMVPSPTIRSQEHLV